MARILIVFAHPEKRSFNHSLMQEAVDYYRSKGDEVKVSDLYAMGFNPIGGKHDFTALNNETFFKYQMEQVHAVEHNLITPELKEEMDKLEWCDTLIFNFPLWWFGLPAILKGWVDRVFAMGFVYGAGKGVYDNGTFKNTKAWICMTTGGPEVAYGPEGKNGSLETILYPIQHGMFYFAGMQVKPAFVSFAPARKGEAELRSELERYRNFLDTIDQQPNIYC